MAKAKKPVYGEPGSVSWGTMNSEHLIPKFASLLESLATRAHNTKDLALVKDIYKRMEKPGYYRSEESDWDLNESLFDRLEAYAPPGHYFGSHPGDGSDYGFWQAEDDEYGGGKRRHARRKRRHAGSKKRRPAGGKRRHAKSPRHGTPGTPSRLGALVSDINRLVK